MKTRTAGTMLRTVALTVLFGCGVATGVAMGVAAAPGSANPCVVNARNVPAATTTPAPTSTAPSNYLRPGPSPF